MLVLSLNDEDNNVWITSLGSHWPSSHSLSLLARGWSHTWVAWHHLAPGQAGHGECAGVDRDLRHLGHHWRRVSPLTTIMISSWHRVLWNYHGLELSPTVNNVHPWCIQWSVSVHLILPSQSASAILNISSISQSATLKWNCLQILVSRHSSLIMIMNLKVIYYKVVFYLLWKILHNVDKILFQ